MVCHLAHAHNAQLERGSMGLCHVQRITQSVCSEILSTFLVTLLFNSPTININNTEITFSGITSDQLNNEIVQLVEQIANIAGIQASSVTVVEIRSSNGGVVVVLRMMADDVAVTKVVNAINNKQVTDGVLQNAVNAIESEKVDFITSASSFVAPFIVVLFSVTTFF